MNYESYLGEINSLVEYISEYKENGYIGALGDIANSYQNLTSRIRYNWYFCDGIMYSDIDENVKGNAMEFDALLHKLKTLKSRLNSAVSYSSLHVDVAFDKLEQFIIREIEKSDISIDIAVAWITNENICNALSTASNKGVQIRILMNDDEINQYTPSMLGQSITVFKAPKHGKYQKNFMHNKFCIFDVNTVITGSYNWTKAANYHNENIVIVLNEEIAKKFRVRFNELVKEINRSIGKTR